MRWTTKLLMLLPYMMFLLLPSSSSLMGVLLGSLMATTIVLGDSSLNNNNNNGAVQLKVSVKEDTLRRAPSCIQTVSQVEMLNTHNYDTITIKSMETISTPTNEPEQLHVPQFSNRVLTLKPGQVAVVPISFFPQFPVSHHDRLDDVRGSILGTRSPSQRLSAAAAAELADLMSMDAASPRHLQDEEHVVHATLHMHTSRGSVETPVKATAVRKNSYGLTDSIVFRDDFSGGGTIPDSSNIYFDNPSSTEELRILEVFASNPDSVKVDYLVQQREQRPNLQSENNAPNNARSSIDSPIAIPPGGKGVYIGSVSLVQGLKVPEDVSSMVQDLGFVHIRTNVDHLIVSVDRLVGTQNEGSTLGGGDANESIKKAMSASPSLVDFGMLNIPYEQTAKVGINVTNHSPIPLRLMRVTIGIDVPPDQSPVEASRDVGLNLAVEMGNTENLHGGEVIIASNGGVAYNAVVISCSSSPQDPSSYDSNMPRQYKGTILIRAGDANEKFEEWRQNVQKNPMAAQHLVLEIPYKVKVLHGSIDFELDQLHFPYWKHLSQKHELVGAENDGIGKKRKRPTSAFSMKRTLYFANKFPISLSFRSIRIGNSTDAFGNDTDFCQRFGISSFEGTDGSLSTAKSGERWGGITLQFFFGKDDEDGWIRPRVCPLILETDKAGEFVIPLIVYSGQLSVEINRAGGGSVPLPCSNSQEENWMDCANKWYSNSTDGKALRSALEQRLSEKGDVKGMQRVEVLSSYLQYIFFGSSRGSPLPRQIHPLLLFLGAIGAGEVETYSLYLSNMNPVPVTVKAPSSAVEGMEISLGRSPRTIMDFLQPTQNDGKDGIRHFLATSPLAQRFFGKMGCSADVNLSPQAASTELNVLFRKNSLVSSFEDLADDIGLGDHGDNVTTFTHPLGFTGGRISTGNALNTSSTNLRGTGAGLLLSNDGSLTHDLLPLEASCTKMQDGFVLPPGAVGRLSLSVHAPSKSALKQDVTSFVGTGLMLETNHGEKMPLFLTYDALMGQFHLSSADANVESGQKEKESRFEAKTHEEIKVSDEHKEVSRIYVPATIRRPRLEQQNYSYRQDGSNITQKEDAEQRFLSRDPNGVELFMESTFSQDMVLRNVESCNNWFAVLLTPSITHERESDDDQISSYNNNNDTSPNDCHGNLGDSGCNITHTSPGPRAETGNRIDGETDSSITIKAKILSGTTTSIPTKVAIGTVHSVISCSGRFKQYSFYSCALEWLEKRDSIQPPGCGLSEEESITYFFQIKGEKQNSNFPKDMLKEGISPTSRGSQGESIRQAVKNNAIIALREVVSYLSTRYDGQDSFFFTDTDHSLNSSNLVGDSLVNGGNSDEANGSFPSSTKHGNPSKLDPKSNNHQQGTFRTADFLTPELLSYSTVQKFQAANDAWKKVCAMGLNIITGTVRAKTDYLLYANAGDRPDFDEERLKREKSVHNGSNHHHQKSSLTVSMPSLILQSSLELPKLFDEPEAGHVNETGSDNLLEFDPTHVAQVSKRYMRVRNPSGVPIRVRLSAPAFADNNENGAHNQLFVQSNSGDSHSWWTGGSYWIADSESNLIQSNHNLTIKSGGGAYVSLVNPSLQSIFSFVLGCGKRCGLRNDVSNTVEKMYSPTGAASAENSVPLEHAQGHGGDEIGQSPYRSLKTSTPPAFAIGLHSQAEIILPPHGTGLLGPIYFRPPKRGDFEGKVYIENSLSGLEAVTFRGRGAWEKVVFLDDENDGTVGTGGDVEVRYGRPTLMFSGSASHTSGKGVVKSVVVANVGDVPADFENVYLTAGETRYSQSSRSSPGHARDLQNNQERHSVYIRLTKCSERGYRLLGCFDDEEDKEQIVSNVGNRWGGVLSEYGWKLSWLSTLLSHSKVFSKGEYREDASDSGMGDSNLKYGFVLQPNETKTLYIEHTPDCTFRSMYASLILEFRDRTDIRGRRVGESHGVNGWERSFQSQKIELLLGYDMGQDDAHLCIPLAPSLMSKFFKWFSLYKDFNSGDQTSSYDDSPLPDRDLAILMSAIFFFTMAWTSANVIYNMMQRNSASTWFHSTLSPIDFKKTKKKSSNSSVLRVIRRIIDAIRGTCDRLNAGNSHSFTWNATFRCLARADPSSVDLVALGKEQTRQVLFGKYKKLSILPTQCLLANGSFARDIVGVNRGGNENGSSPGSGETEVRSTGGHLSKRNAASSQQVLTLSDAMFNLQNTQSKQFGKSVVDPSGRSDLVLPCGLGWRIAANQGIIAPLEVRNATNAMQEGSSHVKELLLKRELLLKKSQELHERNRNSKSSLSPDISRVKSRTGNLSSQTIGAADVSKERNMISKDTENISIEPCSKEYQKSPSFDGMSEVSGQRTTTSDGLTATHKSSLSSSIEPTQPSFDAPLADDTVSANDGGPKAKEEITTSIDDLKVNSLKGIISTVKESNALSDRSPHTRNMTKTSGKTALANVDSKKSKKKQNGEKQQSKKNTPQTNDARDNALSSQKKNKLSRSEKSSVMPSVKPDDTRKSSKIKHIGKGKAINATQSQDILDASVNGEAPNSRGRWRREDPHKPSHISGTVSTARDNHTSKRSKKQRRKKATDESGANDFDVSKNSSRQRGKQRQENQVISGRRPRTSSPQSPSSSITTQSTSESGTAQGSSPVSVFNNTSLGRSRKKLDVNTKVNPPPSLSPELTFPNAQADSYLAHGLKKDHSGTGPGMLRPPPGLAPPPGFSADVDKSNNNSWSNFGNVSTSSAPPGHSRAAQAAPGDAFVSDNGDAEIKSVLSSEPLLSPPLLSLQPNYLSSNRSSSPTNEFQGAGLLASIFPDEHPNPQPADGSIADDVNIIAGTELRTVSSSAPGSDSLLEKSHQNATVGSTTGELLEPAGEFNVINFLDGILNESANIPGEGNEAERNGNAGIGPAPQAISPNVPYQSPPTTISSDPWSQSGIASNTPSYGLAVGGSIGARSSVLNALREDPIGQQHQQTSGETTENVPTDNIPLLTPAIILNGNDEENDENVDDYFGAESSFYADLLGE